MSASTPYDDKAAEELVKEGTDILDQCPQDFGLWLTDNNGAELLDHLDSARAEIARLKAEQAMLEAELAETRERLDYYESRDSVRTGDHRWLQARCDEMLKLCAEAHDALMKAKAWTRSEAELDLLGRLRKAGGK